jgi:hypothetical protein
MSGFLGELGKKLAERWVSLLVLPGAMYLAVACVATVLGHRHALDPVLLADRVTVWAASPAAAGVGGQLVLLAAVLAAAAGAGLVAQALGSAVERLVLAADWRTWPSPLRKLAEVRVNSRHRRWMEAHPAYCELRDRAEKDLRAGRPVDDEHRAELRAAHHRLVRISLEAPDRPTWSGDRIHAVDVRLDRDLYVHLPTIWPHLWLCLPDTARTEITTARAALAGATTLGGWALLYLPLAWWWWPAALISAVLAAIAWRRTRTTAEVYALLLEAVTRLHLKELAEHLGIDPKDKTPTALGQSVTHRLHSQPPPPPALPEPAPAERRGPSARPDTSPPTPAIPEADRLPADPIKAEETQTLND